MDKRASRIRMTPMFFVVAYIGCVRSAQAIPEHTSITVYEGPRTCIRCHAKEALDMFGSVHYQWTGATPHVTNIQENAGKRDLEFNTYCGTVVTSRRIACWSCHAGYGKTPTGELNIEQINNIDCLMCHSQMYKRKAVPPYPKADINSDRYVNVADLARIFHRPDKQAYSGQPGS